MPSYPSTFLPPYTPSQMLLRPPPPQLPPPQTPNSFYSIKVARKKLHVCNYYYVEQVKNSNEVFVIKTLKLPIKEFHTIEMEILELIKHSGARYNIINRIYNVNNNYTNIYTEFEEFGTMCDCIEYWDNMNQPFTLDIILKYINHIILQLQFLYDKGYGHGNICTKSFLFGKRLNYPILWKYSYAYKISSPEINSYDRCEISHQK